MLKTVLRNEMQKRGWSLHTAAKEIGVAHSTILRALRGDKVDVDTIVKIANFLNVRPSELVDSIPTDASLADQLAVLLSHSRELEDQLREAVKKVKDGDMDVATLRDVVGYAMYKFQQSGVSDVRDSRSTRTTSVRGKKGSRKT